MQMSIVDLGVREQSIVFRFSWKWIENRENRRPFLIDALNSDHQDTNC
jgi:hypothetical protein